MLEQIERLDGRLKALKMRAVTAKTQPQTLDDEVELERRSPTFVGELTKSQARLRVEAWKSLARVYDVPYATVKARMLEVDQGRDSVNASALGLGRGGCDEARRRARPPLFRRN